MVKPTYTVQGHKFKLKPTSRRNKEVLGAYMKEYAEKVDGLLQAYESEGEVDEAEGKALISDEKVMFDVFCIVTEGPHDKLDEYDFDAQHGVVAMQDFSVPTATTKALLTGYSAW